MLYFVILCYTNTARRQRARCVLVGVSENTVAQEGSKKLTVWCHGKGTDHPSGPSTAVPPGAPGGLVLGDLPGPATPPKFGESVANVVHVPVGAHPPYLC